MGECVVEVVSSVEVYHCLELNIFWLDLNEIIRCDISVNVFCFLLFMDRTTNDLESNNCKREGFSARMNPHTIPQLKF